VSKLKKISCEELIKILSNKFGFRLLRQKGSRIILKKEILNGSIGTVVPKHNELKLGTLKGILKQEDIDENEFIEYQ